MTLGMPALPEVTVLIPSYNRAHFLPDAIDSILKQTFTDFELLIIDDGSTDETDAVLERYRDHRIRVVKNGVNLGSPKTRNLGLDLARGHFIAMLDSDDVACSDRLRQQVMFLRNNLDHALVGTGKKSLGGRSSLGRILRRRPKMPEAVRARLLFRCCIAHSTVMGRTEILRRFRYDEAFSVSQDYDLFVRLADHHKLANLDAPLVQVRRHAGQVSRQRDHVADRLKIVLKRQLEALGVRFSSDDLQRHFLLTRPRSWHRLGAADLDWAEGWLQRLRSANQEVRRYHGAVFEHSLGEVWFELCMKAMPEAQVRFIAGYGDPLWSRPLGLV